VICADAAVGSKSQPITLISLAPQFANTRGQTSPQIERLPARAQRLPNVSFAPLLN
jgi:hypothetical protein